jgi:hypothetical protein
MNLEEFKTYVENQRKASTNEAISKLTSTLFETGEAK